MPGTPDAPHPAMQHFVDFDEYVDYQLEKTRSQIKQNDIFTTLARLGAGFLAYLLAFVVLDQWVIDGGFGYRPRMIMLGVIVSAMLAILARRVVWPLLKQVHPLYAARVIEKAEPTLKSNLLNYVDLRQTEQTGVAAPVARAMEKRAAVALSHVDVDQTVDRRPLLHVLYLLLALVVLGALYIVFSPKDPFSSVKRALLPAAPIEVATETTVSEVTPGDARVPARSQVVVEADVRGKATDRVQVLFTTNDHKYVDQPVEMRRIDEKLPRFRGTLNGENGRGLLQSLTYRIEAGDARTRDFNVEVIQPPSVRVDSLKYVPPAYTELPTREQPGGDIDGWEGTVVMFSATANMPLKSAQIRFFDNEEANATGEEIAMQIREGTKLSAEWKLALRHDDSFPKFYAIQCKTDAGETDPEPLRYTIRIRPDQRPEVVLLAPTADMQKPANAIVPLDIQATDPDFKIRSLWLKAERNGEEIANDQLFQDREQNGNLGQTIRGNHDFRLGNVRDLRGDLKAGDVVHFWIEARDNKQPIANRTSTPKLKIDIVEPFKTPEEVRRDLAKAKEEQQQQLAQADDARNPDRQPTEPRDPSDEKTPAEPPPPTPPEKSDESSQPNDKTGRNDREPDPRDNGPQRRDGNAGESDPQKPEDFENALQKLLQREREQQEQQGKQPGEQPEEKTGDRQGADKQSKKNAPSTDTTKGNKSGERSGNDDKSKTSPGETASGEKTAGDKSKPSADSKKPEGNSPTAGKKEQKPGDKTGDDKAPGDKPSDDKTSGDKTAGDKTAGDKSAPDKTQGDKAAGSKPSDKSESDKKPADDASTKPDQGTGDDKRGTPEKSKKPGDDQKPGNGGDGEKAAGPDMSKQSKSSKTGDDSGTAEGDPDGDLNAQRAKNELQKKPGSKQGKTGNARETNAPPPNSKQATKPGEGTSSSNKDANSAEPAPNGKQESPQPGRTDDPASGKPDDKSQQPSEKRPGDAPDAGNQKSPGKGRPDGQKSDQPQAGEKGASAGSDQGKKGGNQEGAGDKGQQPGDSEQSNGKKGNPGGEKSTGSESKDSQSGDQPGSKSGEGSPKSGSGKSGSKSGGEGTSSGSPSEKGGEKSSSPGQPGQSSGTSGSGVSGQPPVQRPGAGINGQADGTADNQSSEPGASGGGAGDSSPEDEKANLEHAKKATNLVLEHLKKQLERGEVDEKLLKELGWDKADLERFTRQLEERLKDTGEDNSPEAVARRLQFEETLKSMRLGSDTARRQGSTGGSRTIKQIGTRDSTVPPEYREQWEAYTRSLSKRQLPSKGAAKQPPRTK